MTQLMPRAMFSSVMCPFWHITEENIARDVFFSDVPILAGLDQHELRFISDASIHAFGQMTITGRRHRSLRAMPLPRLRWIGVGQCDSLTSQILVNNDAARWPNKIGMRVKTGIEKRNGHVLSRVAGIGIESSGR